MSGWDGWEWADWHAGDISLEGFDPRAMIGAIDDDGPRYDVEKLARFSRALLTGEVCVGAIHAGTGDEVTVSRRFWLGECVYYRHAHVGAKNPIKGQPPSFVYNSPWIIVPQPGAPVRLALKIAEEILNADKGPPRGHGRLIRLARIVQPKLKAAGHDLSENTIADYIRDPLRDWEKKHPGK